MPSDSKPLSVKKIGDCDEPPLTDNFWDITRGMVHSWQKGAVPVKREQMVYILGMCGGCIGISKFTNMVFW